jgi:hypothetical protein
MGKRVRWNKSLTLLAAAHDMVHLSGQPVDVQRIGKALDELKFHQEPLPLFVGLDLHKEAVKKRGKKEENRKKIKKKRFGEGQ